MTCCIEVWTPTKILECVEDDAGEPVDCFAQAVPSGSYHDLMVAALWQRYRFAVIDSLNVERWLIQRSEERRVGKECRSRWSP